MRYFTDLKIEEECKPVRPRAGEGRKKEKSYIMNTCTSVDIDGAKIRLLREQNELTQLYLATVVGVTTDTISRWENKRYPAIKIENARKLAEALGVPLEELLDDKSKEASVGEDVESPEGDAGARRTRWGWKRGMLLGIVSTLVFAGGGYYFVLTKGPGVRAVRIMPSHTAPRQAFPVLVFTSGETDSKRNTLLIREELSGDVEALGGAGKGESKKFGQTPRWIGKLRDGKAAFLYLVTPGRKMEENDEIRFSGDVIYKEGQEKGRKITGADRITLRRYHWADTDEDYVISDSEILKAFETYSIPGENLINFTAVEELWLAGSYEWNKRKQAFMAVAADENK